MYLLWVYTFRKKTFSGVISSSAPVSAFLYFGRARASIAYIHKLHSYYLHELHRRIKLICVLLYTYIDTFSNLEDVEQRHDQPRVHGRRHLDALLAKKANSGLHQPIKESLHTKIRIGSLQGLYQMRSVVSMRRYIHTLFYIQNAVVPVRDAHLL